MDLNFKELMTNFNHIQGCKSTILKPIIKKPNELLEIPELSVASPISPRVLSPRVSPKSSMIKSILSPKD